MEMIRGFESIFSDAKQVHIVVSRKKRKLTGPEMEWLASQIGGSKFKVQNSTNSRVLLKEITVYRFFELFDLPNVATKTQKLRGGKENQIDAAAEADF